MSDEKKVDKSKDVEHKPEAKKSDDVSHKEARDGSAELTKQYKERREELKKGGKSGITGNFGKPELVETDGKAAKTATAPPKVDKQKEAVAQAYATAAFTQVFTHLYLTKEPGKVADDLKDRTPEEIKIIKDLYRKSYNRELEDDLKERLSGSELTKVLQLLKADHGSAPATKTADSPATKPADSKSADTATAKGADSAAVKPKPAESHMDKEAAIKAATTIHTAALAMEGLIPGNEINKTLAGKSSEDIKAIDAMYKERYGFGLEDQFRALVPPMTVAQRVAKSNEWKSSQETQAKNDVANQLFIAGPFHNESKVREVLGGKSEAERKEIDAQFRKQFHKGLEEHIKETYPVDLRDTALALLNRKDGERVQIPDTVDRVKLRKDVEVIHDKLEDIGFSFYGDNSKAINQALAGKTPQELKAMNEIYEERYDQTLDEAFKKHTTKSLDWRLDQANDWKAEQRKLESEKTGVDRAQMAGLAVKVHDSMSFKPPVIAVTVEQIVKAELDDNYGFKHLQIGAHPAEKLLGDLTPAQMLVLSQEYESKYGTKLNADLKAIPVVGERLDRVMDRTYDDIAGISKANLPQIREKAEGLARSIDDKDKKETLLALDKLEPGERRVIANLYFEQTGRSLKEDISDKFGGSTEEEMLNALKYGSNDPASKIHLAITKDSDSEVRALLKERSAAEIKALETDFKNHYNKSLMDSIKEANGLDESTKRAAEIYRKGADKLTDADTAALVEIALRANEYKYNIKSDEESRDYYSKNDGLPAGVNRGDFDMFKEIMASASPDFRKKFMTADTARKMEHAFRYDEKDALVYAEHGKLTVERIVTKNDTIDDDEDAIEAGLKDMSDDQRKQYRRGAELYAKMTTVWDATELSADDKAAFYKFAAVNKSIDGPCNRSECDDWRDDALVRGGAAKIQADIEGLSEKDWQRLRSNATEKEAFIQKESIHLLTEDNQKKMRELLDKRLAAETFEQVDYAGKDSIEKLMPANRYQVNMTLKQSTILDTVAHMSLDDQKRYRTDDDFKDKVDNFLKLHIKDNDAKEMADRMLKQVSAGQLPKLDLIEKINLEGAKKETDEAQVIRYVEEAFAQDPALRERIANPKDAKDLLEATRLRKALRYALDDDEYDTWAKPVLANGRLSFAEKMDIDDKKGDKTTVFIDVNKLATAKDPASVAERDRVINDANYRDAVFKELTADQRALAENIIKQKGMRPEDILRSFALGTGVTKEEMISTLSHLTVDQREEARQAYAQKYKDDAAIAFFDRLKGEDKRDALRAVRRDPTTPQELIDDTRQEVRKENSGAGAAITKVWGSAAGDMAEDKVLSMQAKLEESIKKGDELKADDKDLKQMSDQAHAYTNLLIKAKEKTANQIADVVLTVATIAVPGGLSLRALMVVAAVGGAGKVAIKSGIMGDNYDSSNIASDFGSGFVNTALMSVGGPEIAKAVGLGRKAAVQAAEKVILESVEKAALSGGEKIIAEGAEKVLEKELSNAAAQAVHSGSATLADKTLDQIVTKVARAGASDLEKAALRDSLKASFQQALEQEVRKGFKQAVTGVALDAGAGFAGGFGSGVTEGLFHWDSSKSFADNMNHVLEGGIMSGAFGSVAAGGMSTVFKVGGKGFRMLAGREGAEAGRLMSAPEAVAVEGEFAIVRSKDAPVPKGKTIEVNPSEPKSGFSRVSGGDYYVDGTGRIYQKVGEAADGKIKVIEDHHARIAATENAISKAEQSAGVTHSDVPKGGQASDKPEVAIPAPKDGKAHGKGITQEVTTQELQSKFEQLGDNYYLEGTRIWKATGPEAGGKIKLMQQFERVGESDHFVSADGTLYKEVGKASGGKFKLVEDLVASPVEHVYDLLKPNNYEHYFHDNATFHKLEGTSAYEQLKMRHELERIGISNKIVEETFPSLAIETSRAENVSKALLQTGGAERIARDLENYVPQYLWRDASGQAMTRDQVVSLIRKMDSKLKSRAADLEFNNVTAKRMMDRMVPSDRHIGEGDVFHEAAQFTDEQIRPMKKVLNEGVSFHVDENHVGLLREIAEHQKRGEVPTGFIEQKGPVKYKVENWRPATAEERNLPLTELTKNLKIVDYGFRDGTGGVLLGKLSLAAHDANDHLRLMRMLEKEGLFAKDASGRGYKDLFDQLGNFHNKDMFNRESELLGSVAYSWRSFPEMHPSYEPPITLQEIAGWLEKDIGHASVNQKDALRRVRELMSKEGQEPFRTEARQLRHVFSSVTTEANEQARKTGLSFLISKNGKPLEVISTQYPEYVALVIDVNHHLGDSLKSEFNQKLNAQMEEYLQNIAGGADPGKFVLKDTDVLSKKTPDSAVSKETRDWMSRHPGFSTRKAPIRDWKAAQPLSR